MLKKSFCQPFNFLKILSVFSLILMVSCAGKPEQPTELRIVDLNGNPKPVKRMVPEGNAQIIASQNINSGSMNFPANPDQPPANPPALQNYQKPNPEPAANSDFNPPAQQPVNFTENKAIGSKPLEAAVSYDMSDPNAIQKPPVAEPAVTEAQPQIATSSNKKFKLAIATVKTGNIKSSSPESGPNKSAKGSGILVQIGSFSSSENANKALEQSKKIASGTIEEVDLGGKKNYRVFLGPYSNSKKANIVLKKARNSGYKDAFIVK